jgi:hypothetical protein
MALRRRSFVSSVCLQCVLFGTLIREVNGHTGGRTSGGVNRDGEVRELIQAAEARLKQLDAAGALSLFERAALIEHSSEIEVGIVRAHMQAGQSQRALAFCAHASGAHLNEPAATVLYAHLLKLNGQTAYAARLMAECRTRLGADVEKRVKVKLTPYSNASALPAKARVLGSGVCLPDGDQIVVPSSVVGNRNEKLWVRFGTGALTRAGVTSSDAGGGLAVLRLESKSPNSNVDRLTISARPVFPGSIAYAMQFNNDLTLHWPHLWQSFIGSARLVDVAELAPSPLGACVFDQTGAAIGLLAPAPSKKWLLVPFSGLSLAKELPANNPLRSKIAEEQIYQLGLNNAVQIIGNGR